ncbi:MAG: prepilin-type N-terminal cleavage/methylation domain-containing protein [Geobacteraceae bacterium]|nr:prepilin-type N-terminal cleavage/methylation domain-containing protein [Geobacteraceae bacterium]
MKNSRGFSLIELIVVCLIMVLVILITSSAFEKIISKSGQLTKASRSNIEGIVGLELMRADLESTGFGLPWSFGAAINYSECNVTSARTPGIDPKTDFNDAPSNPPRAIMSKMATSGSDYLVLKSAAVGDERASRKWSYIGYSSSGAILRSYRGSENLDDNDRIITLNIGFGADAASSGTARQLVPTSSGAYFHNINSAIADPSPGDTSEYYVAYGISSRSDPAMPFNRVDYYVYRPSGANAMSQSCASGPGVGNLYRATINHSNGLYNETPLLTCVLDMQVFYMRDQNNDGNLRPEKSLTGLSSQQIREQVKSIQVSILSQEGGMDRNYTYPRDSITFGLYNQSGSLVKTWDDSMLKAAAGDNWKNYRWKVYTIAVQPKNLNK